MNRIPEEDWKIFKKQHLIAHEVFCGSINYQISEIIESQDLSIVSQFQAISKMVISSAKKENELFLDYRRSTAMLFLSRFLSEGLLSDDDIEEYSEDVKGWLNIEK